MITLGTLFADKKGMIYKVTDMGPWGFMLQSKYDDILTYSNVTINIAIKDGEIRELQSLIKYTIDDLKHKALNNEFGLYTSTNEDGQDVIVQISENTVEISTLQDNGWIRKDIYEYDIDDKIWVTSETYEGKWK